MRGQAAVEWLVILAASLIILFIIVSIASNYLSQLTTSKSMTEAENSVNDLASAAKQVYYEGVGSRQQVFITIPEGVNSNQTGITERTIDINIAGTDVLARTDFDIRGSIPNTPGGYTVWVTAEEGYVLIGTNSLNVNPNSLYLHFFSSNQTQSSQSDLLFTNGGSSAISVDLTMNFTQGNVSASLSNPADGGFLLTPGGSHDVLLNINVSANTFGSYHGTLYANASNGDELTVDIIVDVTSQICNANTTCPPLSGSCTPQYVVINTFNDSTYTAFKDVFDSSEYVTVGGSGWNPSSQVTVNIIKPDGSSVAGYPKIAQIDSQGYLNTQWNTAASVSGTYTINVNDSVTTRLTTFNITSCK